MKAIARGIARLTLVLAAGTTLGTSPGSGPADRSLNVGANVLVSGANEAIPHMEVVACADHRRPQGRSTLLVASMASRRSRWITLVYRSTDGGRSWRQTLEVSDTASSGDPTCAFDTAGRAYYGMLAGRRSFPEVRDLRSHEARIYMSPDGGRTWPNEPVRQFGGIDRPFLVTDDSSDRARHRVYFSALYGSQSIAGADRSTPGPDDPNVDVSVALFVSSDHAKSFSLGDSPRHGRNDWIYGIGNSIVADSGDVITVFRTLKDRLARPYLERRNDDSVLMALRALPGGESAGPAVTIGTVQGGTFPPVAVDQSRGRFHDRVYVAALRGSSIVLFWSGDEGHSWFGPTVVRTADTPSDSTLEPIAFNPGLAVNRDGVVAVGWAEGTHARTDGVYVRSWVYRMAASWDGGATFSDAVTVSSDRHDLSRPALLSFVGSIKRDGDARQLGSILVDPFADSGGHTFGLTADSDGVFHAAWTDNRTGVPQVWTATVTAK